jgi:vitamin B12 transporter
VVTATRIAQPISQIGTSVTVISGRAIEAQKLDRIDQALREVPGVEITQSGSPGSIVEAQIRGTDSSEALVMVDGVEVNSSATSSFDLANITTDNLDRLEVVRGSGGALYGSNAIGGVINLISKEGEGAPKFSLLSEGGTRGTERQLATFNGSQGSLGYAGSLSYFSTEGFRPANDASDNLAGSLRLDEHLDAQTTLRGFARYSRSNVGLVNFSNFIEPIDPDAHQRGEFMLFKGELERQLTDRLLTRFDASFVRNEIRLNDFPDAGNPVFDTADIPDEIRSSTLESVYSWTSEIRSVVGFDFKDRWARSGDHFASPATGFDSVTLFRHRRQEYAGYVEQQAAFLAGLILATAGFRADGNSDFGKKVSPSWSVAIPVAALGLTLRGSYSEGFRAPSFNELFFPNFGNPNLKPEVSSEWDGGFTKEFGEQASFKATFFSRRVHDVIFNAVPCPTCPFGFQPANAELADVQGVEWEPAVNLARELSLSGSFTVLDPTHHSGDPGVRPTRVPRHAASAVLQYSRADLFKPADHFDTAIIYNFFGDRDDFDQAAGIIRSHVGDHRFDVVLAYSAGVRLRRIRNEQLYAKIGNLFDRNYAEAFGFKSPPIHFVGGIKLDL